VSGARYVEVPADRLAALLEEVGGAVAARGGFGEWRTAGRERTYRIGMRVERPTQAIVVYTTLPVGGDRARDCGADAVRIVIGVDHGKGRFHLLAKPRKLLRTAPRGAEDRVGVFLERLTEALREAYARVNVTDPCPDCGGLMVVRSSSKGKFLGCVDFPRCRGTRRLSERRRAELRFGGRT
jgi:hypothetical protein